MKKIMIIEDDVILREIIAKHLNMYDVYFNDVYDDLLKRVYEVKPELVILDLNLPNNNGSDLINVLKMNDCRVLIMTSDSRDSSELLCLNLGADDFVNKPINLDILELRVSKLLDVLDTLYNYRDISLSASTMKLNDDVKLSRNEFIILKYLISKPDIIVSKDEIKEILWSNAEFIEDSALNTALMRLRKKIDKIDSSCVITSQRGAGVMLTCV